MQKYVKNMDASCCCHIVWCISNLILFVSVTNPFRGCTFLIGSIFQQYNNRSPFSQLLNSGNYDEGLQLWFFYFWKLVTWLTSQQPIAWSFNCSCQCGWDGSCGLYLCCSWLWSFVGSCHRYQVHCHGWSWPVGGWLYGCSSLFGCVLVVVGIHSWAVVHHHCKQLLWAVFTVSSYFG